MNLVTVKTRDPATVHDALHEIISLHAVLVRGTVWKIEKIRCFAKAVVLQLPEICEPQSYLIANRPIVILAFKRICNRLPLGMALNASIAGRNVTHVRRIEDVASRRMCDVVATGAVAPLAADVPLSYLLCASIVGDRVAAVAKRAGWAMHVVWWIESSPPVASAGRNLIFAPFVIEYFPLHRQREVVVANFRKVSLFPNAAVNERNLVSRKLVDVISRQIGNDRVGMLARIADDVRHRRFSPRLVKLRVALFTRWRADVMRRNRRLCLLHFLLVRQRSKTANVKNELPAVIVLRLMWIAPSGHSG